RFARDWSSDVCSSDLRSGARAQLAAVAQIAVAALRADERPAAAGAGRRAFAERHELLVRAGVAVVVDAVAGAVFAGGGTRGAARSEERRVGEQCAPWW